MKRNFILLFVVLFCICFSACNRNENTDIATKLSEKVTKMEETTDTEISSPKKEHTNSLVKNEKNTMDFEPNYGIYRSLIDAYTVTSHQTYDGSPSYVSEDLYNFFGQDTVNYLGAPYFKLIDFDGNGVLELVVTALNITDPDSFWAVSYSKSATKVFTLTSENELIFVDDFMLFREEIYNDFPYLSLVTTEVDGETYIITGSTDEYMATVDYTIWKYNDDGFDFVTSLYADIDTDTAEYINPVIDGRDVSQEEVDEFLLKWISESTFSTFIGGDEEFIEKNVDKPMNDAWQFLSDYETVEGDFGDAVFYEGKYVIFEATPKTDAEKLVKQYFTDCVMPDTKYSFYTAVSAGLINDPFVALPCCIVRDFTTVKKEDFGMESIYMTEQLASEEYTYQFERHGVENEFAVRVETEFFKDFDVLQMEPQNGLGENVDWFILEEDRNSVSDYTIYAKLGTSDAMWELDMTPEIDTESFEHLNGTWSIDGSNDTAYVEISDGYYISYYPTGAVESYASFVYDGMFTSIHRYSLFSEGEFTGAQFYYINEDTIMLENGYGEWTTFHRK